METIETMTTKKWNADSIAELLERNPEAVDRAMISLLPYQKRCSVGDYEKIVKFAHYVQGMDDKGVKRWTPKSLIDPHAKIFKAQKIVPADKTAHQLAKEIAMSLLNVLVAIANGDTTLIDRRLHVATLQRGAYKDTITMMAYRNDSIPEDCNGFPFDSKMIGTPSALDFVTMKTYHPNVEMDCETFISNYTLVKERDYYTG